MFEGDGCVLVGCVSLSGVLSREGEPCYQPARKGMSPGRDECVKIVLAYPTAATSQPFSTQEFLGARQATQQWDSVLLLAEVPGSSGHCSMVD